MKHKRSETPVYVVRVNCRPTYKGSGKAVYYRAVAEAAKKEIATPLTSSDVELHVIWSTRQKPAERMDTDNINKCTLDALKGVAYGDDRQVRNVEATLIDRKQNNTLQGEVSYIQDLMFSRTDDVVLIEIFSDIRLAELGGEKEVAKRRSEEFEHEFRERLKSAGVKLPNPEDPPAQDTHT